mmetsp:Transcript_15897/g.34879  ORF Transcript_15897/g.34879 Transcript_15897/m.34879 type:complete len:82 (+) Transcript_15897:251-496(+)
MVTDFNKDDSTIKDNRAHHYNHYYCNDNDHKMAAAFMHSHYIKIPIGVVPDCCCCTARVDDKALLVLLYHLLPRWKASSNA